MGKCWYTTYILLLLELAEDVQEVGWKKGEMSASRGCMCRIQRDETREAFLVWALAGQRQEARRSSMWRVLGQH